MLQEEDILYSIRGHVFHFFVTPLIIDWDKSHCTYMYTSSLKSNEKSTLSQFIGPILGWQNRCNLSWFLFAHNYPSDYYCWFLPLAGLSPGQLDDNPIKGIIIDVQTYSSNISVIAWHITLSVHHFHFITQCWHIRLEFNILKRWYWNKYRIHLLFVFCWPYFVILKTKYWWWYSVSNFCLNRHSNVQSPWCTPNREVATCDIISLCVLWYQTS
mgnify:CR=1 FL=1